MNDCIITRRGGTSSRNWEESPDLSLMSYKNFGALKVQEFVAGTFDSGANYIQPYLNESGADFNWSQPFEIGLIFKYSGSMSHSQVLFGCCNSGSYYRCPTMEIQSGGVLGAGYTTDGSSWTNWVSLPSGTVEEDTWYYAYLKWDGEKIDLGITDDYANYTTTSYSISTAHYHSSSYLIGFGGIAQSSAHCANLVTMQMCGVYIKVNNILVWGSNYLQSHNIFEWTGCSGAPIEKKSVTIVENGTINITPSSNKVLSKVIVTTNISGGGGSSILPNNYQQVAYIGSSGSQYINTGISGAINNMAIDCSFYVSSSSNDYLYGQDQNSDNYSYNGLYNYNTIEVMYDEQSFSASNSIQMTQNVSGNSLIITINGVDYTKTIGTSEATKDLLIFACYRNSGAVRYYPQNLLCFGFTVKDGATKLRDFVPCYRKSDNVAGMYDVLNDVFYTNSGTGSFIVGPNISSTWWNYTSYTYYRLYITKFTRDGDQTTFASIAELKLYNRAGENIARQSGCTYTASSYYAGDSQTPSNAFDGSSSTIWHSDWSSAPNTTNWLMVQLPTSTPVVSFGIIPRSDSYIDRPVTFQLQGSIDGSIWDTLYSTTEMTSGWAANTERILPVEHGDISYIGNNNTRPYIDTGVIPTINTRVKMTVSNVKSLAYFFGCWSYSYNNGAYALCNDGTEMYAGYDGQGGGLISSIVPYDSTNHTIELNKNVVIVDDTTMYTFNMAGSIGNTTYPIFLFCQNRVGSPGWNQSSFTVEETFNLISCKIWENDVLIRDFSPKCDGNGVACIFDNVGSKYYYAQQGSFTY